MSQFESSPLQQRYKSFGLVVSLIASFAMGNFYFGYAIAYFSSIDFNTIKDIYGIDWEENLAKGLLTGCIPIGGGIGALSSNILLKKLTRRQFLLAVNVFAFILGILVYIQNPFILLIVRILQGVCVGLYSAITPVIVKQLSPNEISGSMGSINQLYIASGVFFAFLFKFILQKLADDESGHDIWIYVFGFPLLTILVQTLLLILVYPFETPKYLLEINKEEQAKQLIRYIYKEEFVEEVLQEKYNDIGKGKKQSAQPQSIVTEKYQNQRQTQVTESFLAQQKKPTKVAIFIAIHLAVLQQFVGINAVVGYGGDIASAAIPALKSIFPIIINLQQVLTTFIVGYLLSKVGRKMILQFGTAVGAISNGIIGIGFLIKGDEDGMDFGKGLILFGLIVFMANFGISLGPIVWLYIPEIVQPNIIPFSTGANWGAASLIMLLFPIITKALPDQNPGPLFFFFSAWCVGSFIINGKYTIQTKGKTQKQIYDEYQKI